MNKRVQIVWPDQVETMYRQEYESKRLITKKRQGSDRMSLSYLTMEAGAKPGKAMYQENDEIMYIIDGSATISWEGGEVEIRPGTAIFVPAGAEYEYKVIEKRTQLLCILAPPIE
ncbi:cupin domain-containing protein [Chloroflexota bacterium]